MSTKTRSTSTFRLSAMNPPIKTKAQSSSISTQNRKYKAKVWRRSIRTSFKELKAAVEDIGAKVELIRQGQRGEVKRAGTSLAETMKECSSSSNSKSSLRKKKAPLRQMEGQVADKREETSRMKGEMAGMVQATEDTEAEVELLRLVNTHIDGEVIDEMIDISQAEENLIMEILGHS